MGEIKTRLVPYLVYWLCDCGKKLSTKKAVYETSNKTHHAHCGDCSKVYLLDQDYPHIVHEEE